MTQMMNATIERALRMAEHNDALQTLPGPNATVTDSGVSRDAVIGRIMAETQAKPLAVGLKHQLTQATAQLYNLSDPNERRGQMRLIADLQTRLWHELKEIQKYG
ncbi:MAG: hypothetical protein ACU0A6_12095 [Shimia sp.]|jgi:hypothetical protein|uniref:hypothetical protein n=1 Tax=Shimia sp. TaxID=1954381 RepID=UPI004059F58E